MNAKTKDELYRLAALGREAGLDLAVKWLMAAMLRAEQAGKRRQRKRTVQLVDSSGKPVRAGRFKIPVELLKRAKMRDDFESST